MKATHDVLGEVEVIDASEGLTVLIEHDGQTKEVLRRSVVPLPADELARREQAQAPQPENLHQYKSALANMEQTINDLRRENARLRSLLAAASHYCNLYCNSMDSAAIEAAHDAMIEAAKEAIK